MRARDKKKKTNTHRQTVCFALRVECHHWQRFPGAYIQRGGQRKRGGGNLAMRKHAGAERSGPGAEEKAYDSLLYPLAIGGHFIQSVLHADAHVLNGVQLVHEALSLRVLR